MMQKLVRGIGYLLVAGLLVAVLRQFGWDPFAAGAWVIGEIWDMISHVADLWGSNDTFKEVTKNPSK